MTSPRRGPGAEPHWDQPEQDVRLRQLHAEIDQVLVSARFEQERSTPVAVDEAGLMHRRLLACWTRVTTNQHGEQTTNGASLWGNGLVRVQLDDERTIELLARNCSAGRVAQLVEVFVWTSDVDNPTRWVDDDFADGFGD